MKTYYVNYEDKVIFDRERILKILETHGLYNKIEIVMPIKYNREIIYNRKSYIIENILQWGITQITDEQYKRIKNLDMVTYCYIRDIHYKDINIRYGDDIENTIKDFTKPFWDFFEFVHKNNLISLL